MTITDRRRTAFSLALPLLVLAGLWVTTHQRAQDGVDWDVPVAGYDPRDYLRGHYVAFRLDWPGIDERKIKPWYMRDESGVCLIGRPPRVVAAKWLRRRADAGQECVSVVRPLAHPEGREDSLIDGVFFTGQREADTLGRQLRARGGVVRIRVRDDGLVTVRSLTPNP